MSLSKLYIKLHSLTLRVVALPPSFGALIEQLLPGQSVVADCLQVTFGRSQGRIHAVAVGVSAFAKDDYVLTAIPAFHLLISGQSQAIVPIVLDGAAEMVPIDGIPGQVEELVVAAGHVVAVDGVGVVQVHPTFGEWLAI